MEAYQSGFREVKSARRAPVVNLGEILCFKQNNPYILPARFCARKIWDKKGLLIVVVITAVGTGLLLGGCAKPQARGAVSEDKVMYHCPMHPTYTSDRQGDCPICGMMLVKDEPRLPDKDLSHDIPSGARAEEKTLAEICVTHQCSKKDCPMMIKAHLKPGERLFCPVCGEVIGTQSGKVVSIAPGKTFAGSAGSEGRKERQPLFYRNPMDPAVTSPVPMKDPMGMDYIPVYDKEPSGMASAGPGVTISPDRQQMIGVTTEPVEVRSLTKIVSVSGKIVYDPGLAVAQEEFLQSLKLEENVKDSPFKDVQDRMKSLTDAGRNKLKLLGMSDEQIAALEKSGQAETNLYLPAKGENVWAYLNIYEYEIGFIKIGDPVDLEAVAYPGETFAGRIVSLSPVFDPVTRTNQARAEVADPESKLKPEMFVRAVIKSHLGEKLAVPETAVLDTGLRKIVYLLEPDDVLESREVTLGQQADHYYEVKSGLAPGDVVVTSGNFLIDSESKLKAPLQGN